MEPNILLLGIKETSFSSLINVSITELINAPKSKNGKLSKKKLTKI